MREIVPDTPFVTSSQTDQRPVREWVAPKVLSRRDYTRTRSALPRGMPDLLEVRVTHIDEGIERVTAVVYGTRSYLIHYECKPAVR